MTDHVANRRLIIDALRRELVGPAPAGREIDAANLPVFEDYKALYGPYTQRGTGEEILTRDSPTKRYGVGVLFPWRSSFDEIATASDGSDELAPALADETGAPIAAVDDEGVRTGGERDGDDFDLSLANAYQPSSFGVSFLAELPRDSALVVEVTGGRYRKTTVSVRGKEGKPSPRDWWLRHPVTIRAEFPSTILLDPAPRQVVATVSPVVSGVVLATSTGAEGLDLRVEALSRPYGDGHRLLTVCVVNRTAPPAVGAPNEVCLFQTSFSATIPGGAHILPYPTARLEGSVSYDEDDLEQAGLDLLYRHSPTFATGHGCAADWDALSGAARAASVRAACLPLVETPGVTPDISREDGSPLVVGMAPLAGLVAGEDGQAPLEEIVERYEAWIARLRAVVAAPTFEARHLPAAHDHLDQCSRAANRMRDGLAYLRENESARLAFRLANHAILLQQLVTRDAPRAVSFDRRDRRLKIAGAYQDPDPFRPRPGRGQWRAFQIAFLLASIRSTGEGTASDRELVELIWFPTGGGKTEAYLGLAAFAMFKRRLDDKADEGVNVLMRYTLRLLTAQQFQRASGLACAMEFLRAKCVERLGSAPFSIGIWLGGDTTPNTRKAASEALTKFERSRFANNPFLLTSCPWCGAEFGRVEAGGGSAGSKKAKTLTPGYVRHQEPGWPEPTVHFRCPDDDCPFSNGLPIYVVDDDIYQRRPTFVIGTIDKFAMLAWRPKARALFGLDRDGGRVASPPGLIIQDELHLIAGPLGSLAGLYETAIEELCFDRRGERPIPPKIVSSTATIRRYRDQILGLYARPDVALFPPPGLNAGDSFFARYERDRPGRLYMGVHAASLGSVQTEWVRAFTALLQAPMSLDDAGKDPWWTLLVFFNSIREMGTAHTLFQSDIPDYARVIWERQGTPRDERRYRVYVRELTGGLRSDEITSAINDLAIRPASEGKASIDVCLASNIIEVGIDIPRLSLMVVAGQPKTTSQYIQVTGRVGRQRDRPGLVVTLFSPSKPRDRSHFERFRGYHERLYAHVEPTSVTPFSAPALDRALHAAMVAYARQAGDQSQASSPDPFPTRLIEHFGKVLERRVQMIDSSEADEVKRVFARRVHQWREWHRTHWDGNHDGEDAPQLRLAGAYVPPEARRLSWSTAMSMRNVDASCEAEITTRYITIEEDRDA